jgi:hypothetical protein
MYLLLLTVVTPYLFERFNETIVDRDWANPQNNNIRNPKKLLKFLTAKLMRLIQKVLKVLELVNFIALVIGHKKARRSLAEAFLQVDLEILNMEKTDRYLAFDYVNILVVWGAVGRSVSALLPFFDFSQIR